MDLQINFPALSKGSTSSSPKTGLASPKGVNVLITLKQLRLRILITIVLIVRTGLLLVRLKP